MEYGIGVESPSIIYTRERLRDKAERMKYQTEPGLENKTREETRCPKIE